MSLTLAQIHSRCVEYGDCLLWNQSCTPNGYPRVRDGYAHLMAWSAVHGPVRAGLRVRRTCEERRCCNVDHMQLITRSQQNKIAAKRGAWKSPARIAAITNARRAKSKLTLADARAIRASDGSCSQLAERYGVSRSFISLIKRGRAWAEVRPNASVFHLARQAA